MSDKKLIKEISILTATQAAGQILNLVAIVFLARFLGESDFGMLQVCVAVMAYALIVSEFGLFAVGSRTVARLSDLKELREYVKNQLGLMMLLAVLVIFLCWIGLRFVELGNIDKTVFLLYLATVLPQAAMLDWFGIAMGKGLSVGISRLVKAVIYLLLIIIILPINSNLLLVPIFLIISMISGNIVMLVQSWRWLDWFPKPGFNDFITSKNLLSQTAPIGAANLVQRVLFNFDIVIIGFIATTADAGVYAVAAKLLFVLIVAAETALSAVLPKLSSLWQDDKIEFSLAVKKYLKFLLLILLPIPIAGAIFAKPIITIVYGQQYLDAIPIFRVLSFAYPILTIVLFAGTVLVASDRQKSWFVVTFIGAMIAIITLFALIPAIGVIGAAWAMLIAYIASLLVTVVILIKAT